MIEPDGCCIIITQGRLFRTSSFTNQYLHRNQPFSYRKCKKKLFSPFANVYTVRDESVMRSDVWLLGNEVHRAIDLLRCNVNCGNEVILTSTV